MILDAKAPSWIDCAALHEDVVEGSGRVEDFVLGVDNSETPLGIVNA